MLVFLLTVAAVGAEDVSVAVGGSVELRGAWPVRSGAEPADVRWSWPGGLVTRNRTLGCRGRCALLHDGALRLDDARTNDSGVYRQEVYNEGGARLSRKELTLTVYGRRSRGAELHARGEEPQVWARGWTPAGLSLILLLLIVCIFIRTKRALQAANQSGEPDSLCLEENLYVPMFKAKDLKSKTQTKTRTEAKSKTQSPSDPSDPEEDVYV